MICFSWIFYNDKTCSAMVLHQGSREECERVADMVPGVTESTGKPIEKAGITICTEEQWADICATEPA